MHRRSFLRVSCGLLGTAGLWPSFCLGVDNADADADSKQETPTKMPPYRIDPRDFEAGEADIRAVLDSSGMQLWKHFPGYELEPMLVRHNDQGPISLYQRTEQGEVVVKLDVEGTYWSQFAYQFAHEFCHVLCGFREQGRSNLWFEEMLCETASLFAMRGMAKQWRESPPYKNWASYRDSLRDYVDDIIRGREHLAAIHRHGLAAFWQQHADTLRKNPTDRDLTGAMAVVLLHHFERTPANWEAVRWLNASAAPREEPFAAYLGRWKQAVPMRQAAWVAEVAEMFGEELGG